MINTTSFARIVLSAGMVAFCQLPAAFAQADKGSANRLQASDENFVMDAAKGGHLEVEMGRLGVQKATNSEVKAFAQRMVDDHSKANSELEALAKQKGISLPAPTAEPVPAKLNNLSGAAFDREYVRLMLQDHEKDVAAFEKEAQSGADPEVKNFASKTLPTLRSHLDQVRKLKP